MQASSPRLVAGGSMRARRLVANAKQRLNGGGAVILAKHLEV
jgi:hypothetical protein